MKIVGNLVYLKEKKNTPQFIIHFSGEKKYNNVYYNIVTGVLVDAA